jgi:hypothetical protein
MAALDFSQLTSQPSFGERYAQGQQQALQNQLAKQQMQMQSENALGLREERSALADQRRAATEGTAQRQAFLTGLGAKMSEGGHKLDRPTLSSMLQFGLMNKEGSVIELATKGLRALDEEDVFNTESARLGAGATDQNFTPDQIRNMLVSPSVRIREQGNALARMTPKDALLPPDVEAQRIRMELAKRPEPVDRLLPPDVEAQRLRMAAAGRAPAQPRAESAPVPVVDPATGKPILVSRERAIAEGMTPASAQEGLAPKEIQQREAKYPQATSALKTFESKTDSLVIDLEKLANHPGLSGISGLIYGRTPAVTKEARAAQALYDSIVARGGFAELQSMRAASPTGGALGNVSNQEGQYLRDAFAPINRTQDTGDLKKALSNAANVARDSKQRMRDAYDMTYDYKTGGAPPSQVKPAATAIPPDAIAALKSGAGTDAQFDEMFGAGAAKRARGIK